MGGTDKVCFLSVRSAKKPHTSKLVCAIRAKSNKEVIVLIVNKGDSAFNLFPISQELLQPAVGKRMVEQFVEQCGRQCGHVRAELSGLHHVQRMAQAGGEDFGIEI